MMTASVSCNVCYLLSESRGGQQEPHPIHSHLNASLHRCWFICSLIEMNCLALLHKAIHRDVVQCGLVKIKNTPHTLSQSCNDLQLQNRALYVEQLLLIEHALYNRVWMSRPSLCFNISIQISCVYLSYHLKPWYYFVHYMGPCHAELSTLKHFLK